MITEDFYSGEPVITGSPNNFVNNQDTIIATQDEIEAANMASFARVKYDFDPGTRAPMQPIQQNNGNMVYPGGYGYYQQPMQPGIGMSPYGNYQPTYGMFRPYPGYNQYQPYGYQNQYYYQQQQRQIPTTIHVNGVSFGGEYMPPTDYLEQIDKVQQEFWLAQQQLEAKGIVDRQVNNSVYGGGNPFGFNYYGSPYYSTNYYQYNSLNNDLSQKIKSMQDEARENRMQFQLNLSRLAHNFANDKLSDEYIKQRYTGKDINIPQGVVPTALEYQEQARFSNLVPFDNSQQYREFHARVSKEFHDIVKEDGNLKETFSSMGIVQANWEMEDEMHRRRNAGDLYNSSDNSYKYFVRKQAQERYAREKGIVLPNSSQPKTPSVNQMRQNFANSIPALQGATIKDDGTLVLPCNVGSHTGQLYSVHNSQEAEYNAKREKFGQFLGSISSNIHLDKQKSEKLEGYNYG